MKISTKTIRRCSYPLIGLAVSLPVVSSMTDLPDASVPDHERPSIVSASNEIEYADGILSVKVRDIALADLLDEIARQGRFTVVHWVALEQRVNAEFTRLPLEQAFWRILGNRSYILRYTTPPPEHPRSAAQPETLWILPQGNETFFARPPPATMQVRREQGDDAARRPTLSDDDTEDRVQAAIELGDSGQANATDQLRLALADKDTAVREAAIASLAEIGDAASVQALAIALRDSDPRIREQAVNALGSVGDATAISLLEQARTDTVAFVRHAVTEALDQLKRVTR